MKYAKRKTPSVGKAKPSGKKPSGKAKPGTSLPFHNAVTPEMADKHSAQLKTRMDRIEAEQAASYQTEYNLIAGRVHQGGGSAQQAAAAARHHFIGIHGGMHLPK
jgi:hypothetical protein